VAKIRVLLVDDHALLRQGVRSLLNYYEDVEVVGDARDGAEALERVHELEPDIVLMDIAMSGMNGLEATRRIRQEYPNTRVLVLTQHGDKEYVVPLLKAGASGYVLKRAVVTELVTALRTVFKGEIFLYPPIASAVVEAMQHPDENQAANPELLNDREREILRQIVFGKSNAQIAEMLSLSVKTVGWYRTSLMSKLGVHKATELVRVAIEKGLITKME
jgi:DNA-binding NarL/FixJ family response regulator